MPKKSAAMLRAERELARAVHAMNEKIRYHEARQTEYAAVMPERESVRNIKTYAKTTADIKRETARIRSFGEKTAQTPVQVSEKLTITKWEKRTVEQAYKRMNVNRKREQDFFEKITATSRGEVLTDNKGQPLKAGQLPDDRTAELNTRRLNWAAIRNRSELQEKKQSALKQQSKAYFNNRNDQFKKNYIKALTKQFGPDADKIIKKISKMNARDIVGNYYGDPDANFTFVYKETVGNDTKVDALERIWAVKPADAPEPITNFIDDLELYDNEVNFDEE